MPLRARMEYAYWHQPKERLPLLYPRLFALLCRVYGIPQITDSGFSPRESRATLVAAECHTMPVDLLALIEE